MRQVYKNRPMWKFLLCLIVITPLSERITLAGPIDREAEIAWQAVNDFLSWEKFWYGNIEAESCYRRLVGKKVPVTFYRFGPETVRGSPKPCIFCETPEKTPPRVPSIAVRIGDTVLTYDVVSSDEA